MFPMKVWVCPACGIEHRPGDHDLERCWWQRCEMKIWEYAIVRRASQVASATQLEELRELGKRAEAGDPAAAREFKALVLELVWADIPGKSEAAKQ